jgi:hypothetical protein
MYTPAYVTTPQTLPRTELEETTTRLGIPSLLVDNIIIENGGRFGTACTGTGGFAKLIRFQ